MVGGVEIGDVEVDVLDMVVASRAELYWEGDLIERFGCLARYNTLEGGVRGYEISYPKA